VKTYILFWIKSSKGTDDKKVIAFTGKPDKPRIEDVLERWCKAHPCWNVGENCISYGWRKVTMPPRRELVKSYNCAAERKRKADERWRLAAAMLNPMATTY
jgi:hypothetical protein